MRPRTITGWTALILFILLVGSNAWWLYTTIDNAVTDSYRQHEQAFTYRALDNALRLIPMMKPAATRDQLIADAERLFHDDSFEKDGCTWIGSLGFKFDDEGQLTHVSPSWKFGNQDPCFPQ